MDNKEIDKLICDCVMGWAEHDIDERVWNPTTNLNDTWQVVNRLKEKYDVITTINNKVDKWRVRMFFRKNNPLWIEQKAETAELAICLAALRATGVDVYE